MGAVGGLRTSPRMMGGFFALYQTDGREKGRIDVVWGCLVLPLCDEAVWTWWGTAMFGLVGAQWPSRRGTPRDWSSLFTRRLCKAKRTIVGFRAKVLFVARTVQCKNRYLGTL